jgi:hypothetical protein
MVSRPLGLAAPNAGLKVEGTGDGLSLQRRGVTRAIALTLGRWHVSVSQPKIAPSH